MPTIAAKKNWVTDTMIRGADAIIKQVVPDIKEEGLTVARDEIAAQFRKLTDEKERRLANERLLRAGGATEEQVQEAFSLPGVEAVMRSDYVAHALADGRVRALSDDIVGDSGTAERMAELVEEEVGRADPERPNFSRLAGRIVDEVADVNPAAVVAAGFGEDELSRIMTSQFERQKPVDRHAGKSDKELVAELSAGTGVDQTDEGRGSGVIFQPEVSVEMVESIQAEIDAFNNPQARPAQPKLVSIRPGDRRAL